MSLEGAAAPVSIDLPSGVAQPARDFVGNGRIDSQDLDTVRGDWYADRALGRSCGADIGSDANSDGCLDIVDLQAELAAQSTLTGPVSIEPLVAATPQAIGDPISHTFVVNSTADTADAAPGNGICADTLGRCTLRAAMNEADCLAGDDRIEFDLPGTAPVTIQLASRLPYITSRNGTVDIDGYSQPGSAVNTATAGSNAVLGVEIRGNGQAAREVGVLHHERRQHHPRPAHRQRLPRHLPRRRRCPRQPDRRQLDRLPEERHQPGQRQLRRDLQQRRQRQPDRHRRPRRPQRHRQLHRRHRALRRGHQRQRHPEQRAVHAPRRPTRRPARPASTTTSGPRTTSIGGDGPSRAQRHRPDRAPGHRVLARLGPAPRHDYSSTYQINDNHVIGNWVGFRGDGSYDPAYRSGLNFSTADNGQGINVYDGIEQQPDRGQLRRVGLRRHPGRPRPNATGNVVRNNIIGVSPLGQPAPLTRLGHQDPLARLRTTRSQGNTIRNAARGRHRPGQRRQHRQCVQAPAYNIRITQNIVSDTNGPAIDLFGPAGGGGAGPDPNDPGDADNGANTQLNTPVFTSVTTEAVSGTAYAGASVELYRASRPAGQFGLPIAYLGSTTVAGNGSWTIPVALSAGDLVTALQIMPDDNTSELAANEAAVPAPNQAPVFSTDFTDRTDAEGAAISFDADATDPDGNTLTYSATGLPAGISINSDRCRERHADLHQRRCLRRHPDCL